MQHDFLIHLTLLAPTLEFCDAYGIINSTTVFISWDNWNNVQHNSLDM